METDYLHPDERKRLWVVERVLPLVLAVVLPIAFFAYYSSNHQKAERRAELKKWLSGPPAAYSVKIDGEPVPNATAVVQAMKTIAEDHPHHSGPTDPHLIEIGRGKEIRHLCIARDSERSHEYWVSSPNREGCKEPTFGKNPYFGSLVTDRLASQVQPDSHR